MRFRRLALAAAILALLSVIGVGQAPQHAEAAMVCGSTGHLGAPKVVNVGGDHNPITIWSESGTKHSVWVGHPQYFCPAKVHTDWGYTMYVEFNYLEPTYWFPHWGNHTLPAYRSPHDELWFQELHH